MAVSDDSRTHQPCRTGGNPRGGPAGTIGARSIQRIAQAAANPAGCKQRVEQKLDEPTSFAVRFIDDLQDGRLRHANDDRLAIETIVSVIVEAGDALTCLVRGPIVEHVRKREAEGATPDQITDELQAMRQQTEAETQKKIDGLGG